MNSNVNRNNFELDVTRIQIYRWLLDSNIDFIKNNRDYLSLFTDLLQNVEQLIIDQLDYASNTELNKIIHTNLIRNRQKFQEMIEKETIRKRSKDKLIRDYEFLLESKETNNKKVFSRFSKFITNTSDRLFSQKQYIEYMKEVVKQTNTKVFHKVFLSYAFKDKLYLLGIFDYFYQKNILLYIDAFHNVEQTDGEILKTLLKKELETSEQFLFLRTANSELSMRGSYQIRQWCAWEIGYFDKVRKSRSENNNEENSNLKKPYDNDFYYFRVYEKRIDTNKSVNLLIQSFKQLCSINNGYLE